LTNDSGVREGWSLRDEDHGLLSRIAQALRCLAPLARHGNDLIALGEAWDAIEQIIGGRTVDVNVGLSIGFRRGDRDEEGLFEEGLFMCFRINNEEIILDELNTSYSSDTGSDHFTRVYASRGPDRSFDDVGVEEWLALEEVQGFDDAQLDTERDHV
jgi:hypothetical protein